MDEFEVLCKKARKEARKKGVDLYFKEVYNERIMGDSFALVEYNFDLDNESKIKFTKFIKSFFDDWDGYSSKGMITINTLKAVRFLKVDGSLFFFPSWLQTPLGENHSPTHSWEKSAANKQNFHTILRDS